MRAVDIVMKKRDGGELSREEIEFLVSGYVSGNIPEYQVSSWLMAVFFKGMTARETGFLTDVMLHSGKTIDLSGIQGPFVDKHSTGGVGDKLSLILAPIVASCGVRVPMMSGRSLGHTGGTLDKLESIPGYTARLTEARFREGILADGFAMTGQTEEIVPADRLLYSLRDVTATVESVPLITASILSKKCAEGAEALVFDVKSGPGAFMKTPEDAERLARSLVDTGRAMGKRIIALITDMTEPLGLTVGNFFEVEETLDCLEGTGPADVMEVTLALSERMLVAAGKAKDAESARSRCLAVLESKEARTRFLANAARQGGDVDRMLALRGNYRAPFHAAVTAPSSSFVTAINAYGIGMASVLLGAGRSKTSDPVFPDVGIIFAKKSGDRVEAGGEVCTLYARDEAALAGAMDLARKAVSFGSEKPDPIKHILKEISAL
jgi:pyrimidine-nucleoside phosphorylase